MRAWIISVFSRRPGAMIWTCFVSPFQVSCWRLISNVGGGAWWEVFRLWGQIPVNGLVPFSQEWVSSHSVPMRTEVEASLAPPLFSRFCCPTMWFLHTWVPFTFHPEWNQPEALTRSRRWCHASCTACRTMGQINHFSLQITQPQVFFYSSTNELRQSVCVKSKLMRNIGSPMVSSPHGACGHSQT